MKRVVVTGATGAIGRALVEHLIAQQYAVTVITHPGSKRAALLPQSDAVQVLACELERLPELQKEIGSADAFVHLAWAGTYGVQRNNMTLQMSNIAGTLQAVELCAALGCGVFVGVGSQSEFGPVNGKLNSSLACVPDTGYGAAKLSAEVMSRVACGQHEIRHCWARVLSVYGPNDGPYTMVMSTVAHFLQNERPKFTKAEQIWDFMYSEDAADALIAILERGKDRGIYCLGSGRAQPLRDYILKIRDAVDPALPVVLGELDYYPNQVMHLEADITELVRDTGFTPRYSFEAGIQKTVQWAKEQLTPCKHEK